MQVIRTLLLALLAFSAQFALAQVENAKGSATITYAKKLLPEEVAVQDRHDGASPTDERLMTFSGPRARSGASKPRWPMRVRPVE